jgi:hypothetical protein
MTTTVIPLQDLAQRINQHQAELDTLRKQYEARQADFRRFTARREELQAELLRVEAEIQALGQPAGPKVAAAPARPAQGQGSAKRPVAKASPTAAVSASAQPLSLPRLLLQIVGGATVPMTVKMLTEEAVRRGYATTSKNLAGLVDTRISELIKKRLVRRARNQPGVVAVGTSARGREQAVKSQPLVAAKSTQKAVKPAAAQAPVTSTIAKNVAKPASAKTAAAVASKNVQPLAALITKILSESAEPIPARELGRRVLSTGYQTNSKDFTNVIWVAVSKLDTVENVAGRGYRLKKKKKS